MKYIYILLAIIIITLVSFDIWRKKDSGIPTFNEKPYRDSIQIFQNKIKSLDSTNTTLKIKNDSLQSLKQQVKIIYNEKLVYLNDASTDELYKYIKSNY